MCAFLKPGDVWNKRNNACVRFVGFASCAAAGIRALLSCSAEGCKVWKMCPECFHVLQILTPGVLGGVFEPADSV